MNKITRIVGVDCKIGRNSRTGSTVTMSVPDELILDCTKYFKEFKSGDDIKGKIKKITLVLEYEEDLKAVENEEEIENKILDIDDALTTVTDSEGNIIPVTIGKEEYSICPKCQSKEIAREKRPDGKIWCGKCSHVLKEGK